VRVSEPGVARNAGLGLYDNFEGYRIPAANDLEQALQSALVVLDANVLLNLYRYTASTRDDLLRVLRTLGDRLWIPHQVITEFWRNRLSVVTGRGAAADQALSAFAKQHRATSDALNQWAKQVAFEVADRDALHSQIDELYERLEKVVEEHRPGAASSGLTDDRVLTELEQLLSGKVGPPLDDDTWAHCVQEGTDRVSRQQPPGYLDAEKIEGSLPEGPAGDYLVWYQTIRESTQRGLDVVLITGDEKDDWWWRHRAELLGPRVELVAELKAASGRSLFMMRPIDLLKHAAALEIDVSHESVEDVERVSQSAERPMWTPRGVDALLKRLDAEGREQADVIREAAVLGGVIDRDAVYEIGEYEGERMLRGYTRPTARITRDLQAEGLVAEGVDPMLTPNYGSGVKALSFRIPDEVVLILTQDSNSAG
jgi:rRNA-processing protein FCF1